METGLENLYVDIGAERVSWKKKTVNTKKIKPLEGIMIYLSLEAALPLLQGCDQSWQLYCTLKNIVVFVKKELQTYICS